MIKIIFAAQTLFVSHCFVLITWEDSSTISSLRASYPFSLHFLLRASVYEAVQSMRGPFILETEQHFFEAWEYKMWVTLY